MEEAIIYFIFVLGALLMGFVIGVEYWKRKSILGYENGYRDALENIANGSEEMEELLNDSTFQCRACEEFIMAYTTNGDTNFCPACGSNDIEGVEEECETVR